ncbi:bifunctional phosphopantothenoylcysteine decarboxylase/phosphopantothenate--cysteine ligase CoaBC [Clostridium sp. JN-9]|uniref:bifunctional phosphopantothenoylcysteine decarboxylase/phosphopantothenate--cysteine ligase CoaBC n=1 Tax=Clostridium sp. JN-9 TaxID=2507159 RepID=UPI000FFE0A44|nr:bifunctional phosphopantothenoylcysteine decarboxylase/phosphopantothenate--cysteine ligase CoaBC [Clostridium sp. JN-9]QAT40142.1 bifunctional phosphopantothenoylcysteine decarboxylase/phosphopantothenate--cysteine ligase CoaBC [Clostridium sp. JN-9]
MISNSKKTVVMGVTGGIAAYKALDIVSRLIKNSIEVHVIMTDNAVKFVTPLSFQSLSQNMVSVDTFSEPKAFEIQHISLAKKADIMLIAPATANIIGKIANGIADDMLSTTVMATNAEVFIAPAMNTNMYKNTIVQNNIKKLKDLGYKFINPASGRLACGDTGEGKLADTDQITSIILNALNSKKDMAGKKVLVTAGPTIAPIDPVRFISNRSTGKMGYAIAEEAQSRGAQVVLISGPTYLDAPFGVDLIKVNTNEEMLNAVLSEFDDSDIVIKSAAVADYKPKMYSVEKIKKQDDILNLEFVKDIDILKFLGSKKKNQKLIGFAAESSNLINNAREKLQKKNLDYIVANDITSRETGFASDLNKVTILCKNGEKISLDTMTKRQVAKELFDIINNI